MRTIEVVVKGPQGAGKTRVATALLEILQHYDVKTEYKEEISFRPIYQRLLDDDVNVVVKTEQV